MLRTILSRFDSTRIDASAEEVEAVEAVLWAAAARRAYLFTLCILPLLCLNIPINLGAYFAETITHPARYYVIAIASTTSAFLALALALFFRHRRPRLFVGIVATALIVASVLHGALGAWVANDIVLYVLGMLTIATVLTIPTRLVWPGYALSLPALWLLLLAYGASPTIQFDLMTNALTGAPIALVIHIILYRSLFGRILAERRTERANAELANTLEQLRTTQEQLVEAERQAERARISRDLHDHVGAQVTHMIAEIEEARLSGAAPAAALDRLDADARTTMAQLRETVWALGSAGVTVGDLTERLRRHASRLRALRVTIATEGDETQPLEPAQALHVHRIAQEALTNAAKHSGGTRARVHLGVGAGDLVLTVHDDGTFAEPSTEGTTALRGFGLASMRSRTDELGGTFTLDTDADGTRVRVVVPLYIERHDSVG